MVKDPEGVINALAQFGPAIFIAVICIMVFAGLLWVMLRQNSVERKSYLEQRESQTAEFLTSIDNMRKSDDKKTELFAGTIKKMSEDHRQTIRDNQEFIKTVIRE